MEDKKHVIEIVALYNEKYYEEKELGNIAGIKFILGTLTGDI